MKIQKKVIVLIFALILLLSIMLCACDFNQDNTNVKDSRFIEYGLAYGVNALEAEEAVGQRRPSPIFDLSKLPSDSIINFPLNSTVIESIEKDNLKEMMSENSAKITYSKSSSIGISGLFSVGYETKFSLQNTITKERLEHQYFFQGKHYTKSEAYQLNGAISTYINYLSEEFLSDLRTLNSTTGGESNFINKYGTHIITSVVKGGVLEVYFSLFSSESFDSNKITTAIMSGFEASITAFDANASLNNKFETSLSKAFINSSKSITKNFYIRYKGGKVVPVMNFDDIAKSYSGWGDSLNDEKNLAIVDIHNDGLTPIWDYFPSDFAKAKQKIMNYVQTEANKKSNSILSKLCKGTETDPYRIYSKNDFIRMLNDGNNSKDKYYSLENDLDLGDISSISRKEWMWNGNYDTSDAFQGIFKGNGHTIKYENIINVNLSKDYKNYASGLFPITDNAKIYDLTVEVKAETVSGEARSSFLGGIIGYANKTECYNCTVYGEVNQTDIKCPNGYVCTAGISGFANGGKFNACNNYANIYSFYLSHNGKAAKAASITIYNKDKSIPNADNSHNYSKVISCSGNNNPSDPSKIIIVPVWD